ncbi:response regulator transcription factor [Variovorax rhizosphaerae]|uniref:Response regulator n=1 Tax=Variovorax rhizosphaerae TaxID=1836200 RepID=A0ABU8WYL8_9BURK
MDDDKALRTMLARLLRLDGYRVVTFATGEDFLASLNTCMPACAIIDVSMPGMSGLDINVCLRAENRSVPIVFMSGSVDDALERAARSASASRYLRKPFSANALIAAIRSALGAPHDDVDEPCD